MNYRIKISIYSALLFLSYGINAKISPAQLRNNMKASAEKAFVFSKNIAPNFTAWNSPTVVNLQEYVQENSKNVLRQSDKFIIETMKKMVSLDKDIQKEILALDAMKFKLQDNKAIDAYIRAIVTKTKKFEDLAQEKSADDFTLSGKKRAIEALQEYATFFSKGVDVYLRSFNLAARP